MENHSECLDVAILENIIKEVKTSSIFNEIEQLISEMNGYEFGKVLLNCDGLGILYKVLHHNLDTKLAMA
jgi:hypothetical protein